MDINLETAMERGQAALTRDDYPGAEGHFRKAPAGGRDDAELN